MELFDLHCHIDLMSPFVEFAKETQNENINILAVTTTPKAYEIEVKKLSQFPNIRVAIGIHPQLVSDRIHEMAIFEKLIVSTRYVGEIGLDFSRSYFRSKEAQIDVFTQIIKWCQRDGNKVLSIHSVRSDKYVIDILKDNACTRNNLCILHWFSGTIKELERAIEIGCYFSINDYMLKSTNGRKIIQIIPAERLLLESDAPFILDVKTPEMLKKTLTNTLKMLILIKGAEISEIVLSTSRKLFKFEI